MLQTTAGKMIFCRWPEAGPDDTDRPRRTPNGRERHSGRVMDGRLTPMSSPAVSPLDPRLAEMASAESMTPPSGTPTPAPSLSPERAKTD